MLVNIAKYWNTPPLYNNIHIFNLLAFINWELYNQGFKHTQPKTKAKIMPWQFFILHSYFLCCRVLQKVVWAGSNLPTRARFKQAGWYLPPMMCWSFKPMVLSKNYVQPMPYCAPMGLWFRLVLAWRSYRTFDMKLFSNSC